METSAFRSIWTPEILPECFSFGICNIILLEGLKLSINRPRPSSQAPELPWELLMTSGTVSLLLPTACPAASWCLASEWPCVSRATPSPRWHTRLLWLMSSVISNCLQPHGLQHAKLPCPSLSSGVCSNSHPLSQ